MENRSFGYFGKGSSGYVHYTQAFNRSFRRSSPRSRPIRPQREEPPCAASGKKQGEHWLVKLEKLVGFFVAGLMLLGVVSLLR